MQEHSLKRNLYKLEKLLDGRVYTDSRTLIQYATDASVYRKLPLAVCYPEDVMDVKNIVAFASKNKVPVIPRAGGTSLAGQVVGEGIVVDISRHLNKIIHFDKENRTIEVEPGIILSDLNYFLKPHGLFFAPETSTANRCCIGGMIGNNACGLHSLIYGSAREHVLEVKTVLSDGTEAEFKPLTAKEFDAKCKPDNLEGNIYRNIREILGDENARRKIKLNYPDPKLQRRNTGYALDLLMDAEVFGVGEKHFNFTKLLCGSEGTLCFTVSAKLNLLPLPPENKALVCVHHGSVYEALDANILALKHSPSAIELMDKKILDLTKENIEQQKNRFFLEGDPGALLIVEIHDEDTEELERRISNLISALKKKKLGYAFPIVKGGDIQKVWNLRKSGLGVLSNMAGDARPVSVIEDTSVLPDKLPQYIRDFDKLLEKNNLDCVYHAHIATGEIHLRPVLNLKTKSGVKMFRKIGRETAMLVKKYKGSMSGEHGDGRVRSEFIQLIYGKEIVDLFQRIKHHWDPHNIMNPCKIVDPVAMTDDLRYKPGVKTKKYDTYFDFSDSLGIVRAAERCNGSGDCRKSHISGGTMCPSYMVTRNEKDVTRARANVLREFLTHSDKKNPFDHEEIKDVMELCLSCKACKSECPSNVDVAKLKAEFLQQYYDVHKIPLSARLVANFGRIQSLGSLFPGLYNFMVKNKTVSTLIKEFAGFHPDRSLPELGKKTLKSWIRKNGNENENHGKTVYLFADEFTNTVDSDIGIKAVLLLEKLCYEVVIPKHLESGRTYLSKGLVKKAAQIAHKNVELLHETINAETPLIGIEPSAILTFRDEYIDLLRGDMKRKARKLSKNVLLIEEFLNNEMRNGAITPEQFTDEKKEIHLHGHCYQKALTGTGVVKNVLGFPKNYKVKEINSGCCGMAGSFGYEKDKYEISMKIGELVLLPAVRKLDERCLVAAPGTSCRHQIKDGAGRKALHPVEILYEALVENLTP